MANSFGQLGPKFLRFLWTLVDHAARNYIPVPLPVLPLPFGADSSEEQDSPQIVRLNFSEVAFSKVPLGYGKETLWAVCYSPLVSTPSY